MEQRGDKESGAQLLLLLVRVHVQRGGAAGGGVLEAAAVDLDLSVAVSAHGGVDGDGAPADAGRAGPADAAACAERGGGRGKDMSADRATRAQSGGPFRRAARAALTGHVPVRGPMRAAFGALYRLHVIGREGWLWALRFFWFEPLFRSQCAKVGCGLRMEQLPYVVGQGRIVIGDGVRLSGKPSIAFSKQGGLGAREPELEIGDGTFIGHGCSFGVASSVRIGNDCLLAGGVSVRDWDGHPLDAGRRARRERVGVEAIRPVVIEDGAWIGGGARFLRGVRIGARSVVGAGAVVACDVPPDCVVAGNPARVVKVLAPATEVEGRMVVPTESRATALAHAEAA